MSVLPKNIQGIVKQNPVAKSTLMHYSIM
jgi:hypothetical protein